MHKPNRVKQLLRQGSPVVGPILGFYAPAVVEIMGYAGFDYIMFDCEHGNLGVQDVENMVRAAHCTGAVPLVRVTRNEAKDILRVMDAGAYGIMVPQIQTADDARQAVASARYFPAGQRGMALSNPAGHWGTVDRSSYFDWVAKETLVMVQIETAMGVDNLPDILAVEGVDAVIIGPSDLSQSLGVPGQLNHPLVKGAMDQIVSLCRQYRVPVGTVASTPQEVLELHRHGYSIMLLSVAGMLMSTAKGFLAKLADLGLR